MAAENQNLALAVAVVEELTPVRIHQDLKITMGAISQWKTKGIPSARLPYLQIKFPYLKAWRLLK